MDTVTSSGGTVEKSQIGMPGAPARTCSTHLWQASGVRPKTAATFWLLFPRHLRKPEILLAAIFRRISTMSPNTLTPPADENSELYTPLTNLYIVVTPFHTPEQAFAEEFNGDFTD